MACKFFQRAKDVAVDLYLALQAIHGADNFEYIEIADSTESG